MKRIVLTNDDGIHAEGLWILCEALSETYEVTVVAPDRERSAVGHGITLHEPLRAVKVRVNGGHPAYAVSGTPADCVKLAMVELFDTRPDMVISGINPGPNVGVNLNYSGTVGAAREAALYGIAAMAVSASRHPKDSILRDAARFVRTLAGMVLDKGLPRGTFLNVNIPGRPLSEMEGIRISRQDAGLFCEYFEKRTDPRNNVYYWQGCDSRSEIGEPDADSTVLSRNFISVTPVKCDMTDYGLLEELRGWNILERAQEIGVRTANETAEKSFPRRI